MNKVMSPLSGLNIAAGGCTVLYGPTGVGKTTLLRQICGHLSFEGRLCLGDQVLSDEASTSKIENRRFGYLAQKGNLIEALSVTKHLELALRFSHHEHAQEIYEEVIELCEIAPLLNRSCATLSGGQAQQVAIAMMLLNHPRWLLLDEPFSALDRQLKYRIISAIKNWCLQHNISILCVTHDIQEVVWLADHILLMNAQCEIQHYSYDSLVAEVDSDFVMHHLTRNRLRLEWNSMEHNLQRFSLEGTDINVWVQGNRPEKNTLLIDIPLADISLSLSPIPGSSILNQLPASISRIGGVMAGYQYVSLLVGGQVVSARLTAYSVEQLELKEGTDCFMCFKTPQLYS